MRNRQTALTIISCAQQEEDELSRGVLIHADIALTGVFVHIIDTVVGPLQVSLTEIQLIAMTQCELFDCYGKTSVQRFWGDIMKVFFRCLWIVILFSTFSPAHAGHELLMCSAVSPPWTIKKSDSPSDIEGMAVDIMSEVSRRGGFFFKIEALPFKRCLKYIEHGIYDGCYMTIKNAQRESYAEFTDSYLEIPTYVYYDSSRVDSFEWNSWEDLKSYRIGSQRGFRYGQAFTNAKDQVPLRIVEIPSVKVGFEMILKGRLDLVLSNEYRFKYLAKLHPELQGRFSRAQKPVGVGSLYIAMSKKSPHVSLVVPRLNEILAKMKADGTIQKIVHP